MLWQRPPSSDIKWFLFGTLIWAYIQSASIAYGRHEGPLASRYLDLYAILILINFICLLSIIKKSSLNQLRYILKIFSGACWVVIALVGVVGTKDASRYSVQFLHQKGLEQESNTRNYVATGNMSYLINKPLFSIPYPDPDRLANILSKPNIRSILPSSIAPSQTRKVGHLDPSITRLLINYRLFLYTGLLFSILTLIFLLLRLNKAKPFTRIE